MPSDCIAAYTVVGPTKRKPRLRSSADNACEPAVAAGRSERTWGAGATCPRRAGAALAGGCS